MDDTIEHNILTNLKKSIETNDLHSIIKISNELLPHPEYEQLATKCHIMGLLKKDRYKEALDFIKSSKFVNELKIMEMYCFLEQNNYQTIIDYYSNQSTINEIEKEILFLANFHLGNYTTAYQLTSNPNHKYACNAGSCLYNETPTDIIDPPSQNIECLYNQACFLIGMRQYEKAVSVLESVLNESCSRDMECYINLQLNYLSIKMSRDINNKNIFNTKITDDLLKIIASNNCLCFEENLSWFEKRKKMRLFDQIISSNKLPLFISEHLLFNQFLVYLNSSKHQLAINTCKQFECLFSSTHPFSKLMHFYLSPNSIEILFNAESETKLDLVLNLTRAEIHKRQERFQDCAALLVELTKYYNFPILIAFTFKFISEKLKLEDAILYLRNILENSSSPNPWLVYLLCISHTRVKDFVSGQAYVQKLKSMSQKCDPRISALVRLYDYIDSSGAQSYVGLKPSDIGMEPCHVSDLESSLSLYRSSSKKTKETNDENNKNSNAHKKKRKRKIKLPKYYDPTIPPNPERWLPKHERTGYKPKKKDKLKKGCHQGAAVGEIEETVIAPQLVIRPDRQTKFQKSKRKTGRI